MTAPVRLTAAQDIRAVFGARAAAGRDTLVVHARSAGTGTGDVRPAPRVAVVAGRRVGGAVQRNRAKRRLRAALREVALPPGTDLVVTAKPPAVDAPFAAVVADLSSAVDGAARRASRGAVSR